MSGLLTGFAGETLLWTGALIALVLLLRRPVARHFGPQAAYALWFVPLLRLILPPVQLPAWLSPAAPQQAAMGTLVERGVAEGAPLELVSSAPAASAPIDYAAILAAIWLAGAGMFLIRRFALYFQMRRDLLTDAKPVGEQGRVRMVEVPGLTGPVAFGVFDKVVALPIGFMAMADRQRRDLALEHELAHHRGHDLLVNVLVQPLFALHWFNPLGWMGWQALRRDQEAACDARVVARRPRQDRAAYANVIADYACRGHGMPQHVLAAPMACPVLGDKSIINRLKGLAMPDISARRRLAGRALLLGTIVALPLTATVSYAESIQAAPPLAPEPPAPPAAPVAPAAAVAAPDAAWTDGEWTETETTVVKEDDGTVHREHRVYRVVRQDGEGGEMNVVRLEDIPPEQRAQVERQVAGVMAQRSEIRRQVSYAVAQADAADGHARITAAAAAHAAANAPRVVMQCKNENSPVTTETDAKGKTTMYVCESYGERLALTTMQSVRGAFVADRTLSANARAEAISALDTEIARHGEQGGQ